MRKLAIGLVSFGEMGKRYAEIRRRVVPKTRLDAVADDICRSACHAKCVTSCTTFCMTNPLRLLANDGCGSVSFEKKACQKRCATSRNVI
jgi:hypothetical protein